ncbi:efflux RND transporter periplasmic adaptor subunit [Chitiniphilus purpureus]|uniref:Efflux RND transporter periplasmic adaptor subunit n=1 Tax=Chitiniphilus purpureus TaxID=2981137 RepID=A0ABY6DPR9_9NEIS|nr:efflux RND transporter periplasmic adaptor subunit [Chitiniphilus sp. CD1]UXY15476.1 efflux RND transporter periplasmic adaptor subunit [Chitiniphilus sp. CD1]
MKLGKRIASVAAAAIVLGLAGFWLAGGAADVPSAAPAGTPWVAVGRGRVDVEGGVVRLAAQRDGVVQRVDVEEGDTVRAGQLLAALDDRQARLQAALAHAEYQAAQAGSAPLRARLAAAQREARRLQQAVAGDLAPGQTLDAARDQVAMLSAELALAGRQAETLRRKWQVAQYEVARHTVRAPSDGHIVRRDVRPGDGISTLNVTPLFLFAPARPRIVRAEFEERFIPQLRPGDAVQIVLEADEQRVYPGRLVRLSPAVGLRTRSDDPSEKQDVRVVEAQVSLAAPQLLIGQRVLVRVPRTGARP